jgi:hypothetical protein
MHGHQIEQTGLRRPRRLEQIGRLLCDSEAGEIDLGVITAMKFVLFR